jgi:hypothetical protein
LILADTFDVLFDSIDTSDKCNHPENVTYHSRYNKREKVYLHDPSYLNGGNACHWFKKKLSIFDIIKGEK